MNVELFISRRLYKARRGGKRISRPAVTIAQCGVSVGLIVMLVSMAVVVGFKQEVRDKIIGFGGHIQINNYEHAGEETSCIIADDDDFKLLQECDGVTHVQQFIHKPGLISVNNEFEGVIVKGLSRNYDRTFFDSHIVTGEFPSDKDTVKNNWIVLSNIIAKKLNCKVGDKINIYFVKEGIKARRMQVSGIYETHLFEMDNLFVFTDIETMRRLNNWEENKTGGIEIIIDDFENIEQTRSSIMPVASNIASKNDSQLYVQTIEEINPALFAWLGVLDRTVWIILILVLGIAGFTMISGLLILILEKSNLIGILKAVGAKNISIRKIFLYYACFIIGKGMLWGNIIGIALCLLQRYTGIISLDPEMYYMDCVPIEFSWWMIPMNIFMFIISVAMLLLPSLLISKIEPSKAIKFE